MLKAPAVTTASCADSLVTGGDGVRCHLSKCCDLVIENCERWYFRFC